MAPPQCHMFYIGLYREKHEKIFLSKTTWPGALIFGMKHHLMNLYQVCLNYIPGAKIGSPRGSHVLHWPIYASPSGPLPSLFNYAPGVKNGPAPGVARDMVKVQ